MLGANFIDLVDKYKFTYSGGLEDTADRASFVGSVIFLLISTIIVSLNTLVFQPLACFTPTTPSGMNFNKFVDNYCWLEGTYAFLPSQSIPSPSNLDKYENVKIGYYQWISFALALQCIMFYLPRVMWQSFYYCKVGICLESLIMKARDARNSEKCSDACKPIANKIESVMYCHRDFRHGAISSFRRKLYTCFGIFVASKRLGTWLVARYFFMKLTYLVNAILQLVLLSRFFQSNTNFIMFGYELLVNTINQTQSFWSRIFPRVTFCYVPVKNLGAENYYISQCSLPQNMVNEKIFAFLYLWIALVAVTTIFGIFIWIKRTWYFNRIAFIKKCLDTIEVKNETIDKFTIEFLQHDGYFIIHMIYLNAGDIVTTEVLRHLVEAYQSKYSNTDLRKDPYYKVAAYTDNSMAVKPESKGVSAVKRTAPSLHEFV